MKKILFICETHYQFVVACKIKTTLKRHDEGTIIFLNMSFANNKKVETILTENCIFNTVIFDSFKYNNEDKKRHFLNCCFVRHSTMKKKISDCFDEVFAFNYDLYFHEFFCCLWHKNKRIKCFQFEEGLLSYKTTWKRTRFMSLVYLVRKLLLKKNAIPSIRSFYCFSPEYYDGPFTISQIDKIEKTDFCIEILKKIYSFNAKQYRKTNIIYLASIYDLEGGKPINELSMIESIQKLSGKCIMVRPHPRDTIERFEIQKFLLDENLNVPIEIINLLEPFNGKTLISSFSGSFLNISSMSSFCPKMLYTFNLLNCDQNELAKKYKKVLTNFIENNKFDNIIVINNLETMESLLK